MMFMFHSDLNTHDEVDQKTEHRLSSIQVSQTFAIFAEDLHLGGQNKDHTPGDQA